MLPARLKRLVVLDGFTLNPGDLSWASLQSLVDAEIHPRTAPADIVPRASGAHLVLTNKTRLDARILQSLPDLRYIGVLATGYDVVDTAAARNLGIVVSNVPAYGTSSVAQIVFAYILHWSNSVALHHSSVTAGHWTSCPDFSFWNHPLRELEGKNLGIIGFGRIGRQVGRIGHAFRMKISTVARAAAPADYPVEHLPLDDLFSNSDFLCLLCPLTPDTRGLVNSERLRKMKPSSFLINTARGPLVNEQDLADALNQGVIAGAAIDVLSAEPPSAANPLLSAKNIVITPHLAWATVEARTRLMKAAVDNVRAFLDGRPANVVN
jgi:glycerate dehydrogenase